MRTILTFCILAFSPSISRADFTYQIANYAPWLDGWEFSGQITVGPGAGELGIDVALVDMELTISKGLNSYVLTEAHFVSQNRTDIHNNFVGLLKSPVPFTEAHLDFYDPVQDVRLRYWNLGEEAHNFPALYAGINLSTPSGSAVYREEYYWTHDDVPIGEIRGFLKNPLIATIPEPSSMALVFLGLVPFLRARKW